MTKIALAQMDIAWLGFDKNLQKISSMIQEAETKSMDWIVFPEMSLTGFCMEPEKAAIELSSPIMNSLLNMTIGKKIAVMIGVAIRSEDAFTNDFLILRNGELLHCYSKINLFTITDEDKHYSPGDRLLSFELDDAKVTPLICFDTRFPDLFSQAAGAGTELFVIMASWPKQQASQWKTLLSARAVDTQSFVVGVNRVGSGGGLDFAGDCNIFTPGGKPIGEFSSDEKLIFFDIDPKKATSIRGQFPVLYNQHLERKNYF